MLLETLPEWPIEAPGSTSSSLVPTTFPVALDGVAYALDLKSGEFRHQSIPMLRQQADDSSSPSEASLNPEDLWRRAQSSWHLGAGQTFRDRDAIPDSTENRFRSSKGIDVWEKYEFSLLPATDQKDASTDTNVRVQPAGSRLYKAEGDTLTYTTDVTVDAPTWNAVTYAGGDILSIASDGFHVWVTDGTDIYVTNTGITTTASHDTLDGDVLGYVKARLMVAHDNAIYDDTLGATPSALFSHNNTDFRWVGFASGKAAIYAAGFSGDKSLIYRIAVKPDATGLDQPIVAAELPDGEIVRSVYGYNASFVFIGTDLGWRFALPDTQGNLELSALVETDSPVRCFEGQENFVWFGLSDFDGTSTGLGRIDVSVFGDPERRIPAYASDLMATTQGDVLSVATFQNIRCFTVSESGVWAQDTDLVEEGSIDSGLIGYGLPDHKTALFVDVRTQPLAGSHTASLAADGGVFSPLGTQDLAGSDGNEFTASELQGERFELRLTLDRDASDTTDGPTVTRWTLKATPQPGRGEMVFWPLLLTEDLEVGGQVYPRDPALDLERIKGYRRTQALVNAQEGNVAFTAQVVDFEWRPTHLTESGKAYNGSLLTKMRRIQ